MIELFANSGEPDQTLHSASSDLGLHCLPVTLLGVSRLQLFKELFVFFLPLESMIPCPSYWHSGSAGRASTL